MGGRPVSSNRFSVTIGPITMSFSKIKNISKQIQYDVLKEGGVNDYVHIMQKAYSQPHKLVLEKGLGDSSIMSMLVPALVGKKLPFPGTINIKNSKGDNVATYTFDSPIIVKWQLGELNALENKVLIESMEIVHNGISANIIGNLLGMIF